MLGELKVERTIEIGPGNTLTNMMKRTRDLKYRAHDAALGLSRKFLSSGSPDIYYDIEGSSPEFENILSVVNNPPVEPAIQPLVRLPQTMVLELPDEKITVSDIIIPLVAFKLKKDVKTIETNKSIKQLAGGEDFSIDY